MKTTYFITLIYALILALGINALKINLSEKSLEKYNNADNIKKNIAFNGERKLDVYYNKRNTKSKKKVVIHFFGSSWIHGDKINQTSIGSLLESEGYVAVVPNYVLFPNGTIEDMVDDVYKAIQWTYKNISKYGGNPKKIYVCAHSSGAHITALTIVKSTLHLENNGVALKSLPALKKVILLNGPYIFDQEFIAYTLQGTNDTSNATVTNDPEQQVVLQQLMMKYFNDASISPIAILKGLDKDAITNKFNVGKFIFFYTSKDNVIPESSSKGLISEISRTSKCSFEYMYEEGFDHNTVIDGVNDDIEEFRQWYMDLIRS